MDRRRRFLPSQRLPDNLDPRQRVASNRLTALGNYYLRRALRLTPPLAVICLFQFARAPFPAHAAEIRHATIVGGLYLENWTYVFNFGDPGLMGHTCSLAVEEQFYWLWPIVFLFIATKRPPAWLCGTLAFILIFRVACWYEGAGTGMLQFTCLSRDAGRHPAARGGRTRATGRDAAVRAACGLLDDRWDYCVPAWRRPLCCGPIMRPAALCEENILRALSLSYAHFYPGEEREVAACSHGFLDPGRFCGCWLELRVY
jgi:hypothetical protein